MENVKKIYFFGDSIFYGQHVSPHKTYISKLSKYLGERGKAAGTEVVVQNSSISGNTTRMALERMQFEVLSHKPSTLVVQFGLNDCNYWESDRGVPRTLPGSFVSNLLEIIERARAGGVGDMYLLTNHPTALDGKILDESGLSYQQNNQIYNTLIRKAASIGPQVELVDIEKIFSNLISENELSLEDLLLPDGLHLSPAGHDVYYRETREILFAGVGGSLPGPTGVCI